MERGSRQSEIGCVILIHPSSRGSAEHICLCLKVKVDLTGDGSISKEMNVSLFCRESPVPFDPRGLFHYIALCCYLQCSIHIAVAHQSLP